MEESIEKQIIEYLVDKLQPVGKTQLQKSIYFVKEAKNLPLNFDFIMYHYGPYSKSVENLLTEMRATGDIKMAAYPHRDWLGFEIKRAKSGDIRLPQEFKNQVDEIINFIKPFDAQETELCATIHFVYTILKERKQDVSKERLSQEVKNLKPRLQDDDITKCYRKLSEANLLSIN